MSSVSAYLKRDWERTKRQWLGDPQQRALIRQARQRDLQELTAWWKRSTPSTILEGLYLGVGSIVGALGAIAAFLIVLVLAVDSAGWVIGLVFGWILGIAAAAIAFWVCRYMWPILLLLLHRLF